MLRTKRGDRYVLPQVATWWLATLGAFATNLPLKSMLMIRNVCLRTSDDGRDVAFAAIDDDRSPELGLWSPSGEKRWPLRRDSNDANRNLYYNWHVKNDWMMQDFTAMNWMYLMLLFLLLLSMMMMGRNQCNPHELLTNNQNHGLANSLPPKPLIRLSQNILIEL